jgi:hypothetical protein
MAQVPNCGTIVVSARGEDPNDYAQYVSQDNGATWMMLTETRRISVMDFSSGIAGWGAEDKINELSTKAFQYQGSDLCDIPCPSTSEITLEDRTATTISVSWEPVDEATGYKVRCREHFGSGSFGPDQTYFVGADQLNQTFWGLSPLTFYQVRVFTWCSEDMYSFPSTRLRVRTKPANNLMAEETDFMNSEGLNADRGTMAAWPNPTSSELNISLTDIETEGAILSIFDATGRQVATRNLAGDSTATLDMANMPAGMYTIKVITANGEQLTERISKI